MKLACASTAFHERLSSGELTQLEWLDLCARELAVDGVVCDVRHFPRRDSDYLAQVKKMAVDLGLTVAAVYSEGFFGEEAAMQDALALADLIGAPIVSAPLAAETSMSWSEQLERIGAATSFGKSMNLTIAVRNRPKTFAGTSHDVKRVSKESDSAWLRYALDIGAFDTASEPEALMAKAVLLWHEGGAQNSDDAESGFAERLLDCARDFRGFLVLDYVGSSADAAHMHNAVRKWRTILAEEILGDSIGA